MSQNSDYDDLNYFWTSEKDKWFLVRHIRGEHSWHRIYKLEGKEVETLYILDGDNRYSYIVGKMIENGCRIITEEEFFALRPKPSRWRLFLFRLDFYYSRIGISVARFILRHKTLENFVVRMLSPRDSQRP
jgi:hypothetical protein